MGDSIMTILDNTLMLVYVVLFLSKLSPRWVADMVYDGGTSYQAMSALELVFVIYLLIRTHC